MIAVISDPMLAFSVSKSGRALAFSSGKRILAKMEVEEVRNITLSTGHGYRKRGTRIILTTKNSDQLMIDFPEGVEGQIMYQQILYADCVFQ